MMGIFCDPASMVSLFNGRTDASCGIVQLIKVSTWIFAGIREAGVLIVP